MTQVVLSYSRKDIAIMQRVNNILQSNGLKVWTDQDIELGIPSWKVAIENAIRNATCLICIMSPEAANSEWVRAELDFAQAQRKQIFLLLARGSESDLPLGYTTNQWADIRDDETAIIRKLMPAIENLTNKPVGFSYNLNHTFTSKLRSYRSFFIFVMLTFLLIPIIVVIVNNFQAIPKSTSSDIATPTTILTDYEANLKDVFVMWTIAGELDNELLSAFNSLLIIEGNSKPIELMQSWVEDAKLLVSKELNLDVSSLTWLEVDFSQDLNQQPLEESFFRLWKHALERQEPRDLANIRFALQKVLGEERQRELIITWNQQIEATTLLNTATPQLKGQVGYLCTVYITISESYPPTDLTVKAIASIRLLLSDLVGELEQQRLIGEWNRGRCITSNEVASVMTLMEKIEYVHTIYKALLELGSSSDNVANSLDSLRLFFVELAGEPEQQRLFNLWGIGN